MGEQVGGKHKERRTGGMANLQPVAGSNEFGTIPQAGCGFNRCAIHHQGYGKRKPSHADVNAVECVLLHMIPIRIFGKGSNWWEEKRNLFPYIYLTSY